MEFLSVTNCGGNCDEKSTTEWHVHGLRKEFVTDDFKIVTEMSVTIKKYVKDCDGPITI